MSTRVVDVGEADFETVVVEGSRTRPVVVDLWAPWCGPCVQLSPLLESMADAHAGEVDVVKVNIDENPGIAQKLGVQGIPAVKAYADGRVVSEFTGLQPAPVVERFFAALAPSAADRLVARAAEEASPERREALLHEALAVEVDHPGAAVALAGLLDDDEAALQVLGRARPTPEVQQALARRRLGESAGDPEALRRDADAGDAEARVALGRALIAAGDTEQAVDELLVAVRHPDTRELARTALLDLFTALGAEDPVVARARPRLASALF